MSYQVLARKYRPKNFETLVGQEHVVRALSHALDQQRLHHAYLFTGTRGVGKTTLSRILAKAFNCEQGITAQPCGVCNACTAIDAGRFVDYIEMDAASNRGVEEMATLLEQAIYAPSNARFKVYMIDEVHMLTNHAFNAMLKTLEEPPAHVKFILATTDPQKIPVTVLSRCLQFNLKQMPPGHIVAHLDNILGQENIEFELPALRLLAQGAHGSMRDALSLTDQAIAYAAGKVSLDAVQSMLGALDQSYLLRLLDALAADEGATLISVADEMAARSLSYKAALQDFGSLLHQIAVAQLVPAALSEELPDREQLVRFAGVFSKEEIQLYYQIVVHGRNEIALAPDEYAGFTMTLLRMLAFRPSGTQLVAASTGGGDRPNSNPRPSLPQNPAPSSTRPASPVPIPHPSASVSERLSTQAVKLENPAPTAGAVAPEKPMSPAMAALAAARSASAKNAKPAVAVRPPVSNVVSVAEVSAIAPTPRTPLAPLPALAEKPVQAQVAKIISAEAIPPWDDLVMAGAEEDFDRYADTASDDFWQGSAASTEAVVHANNSVSLNEAKQTQVIESNPQIKPVLPPALVNVSAAKPTVEVLPVPALSWDGHWPDLAAKLPVRGVTQQLALQSELRTCVVNGRAIVFKLCVPVQTLLSSSSVEKLTSALKDYFSNADVEIRIETEIGAVEQTANAQAIVLREERQQQAQAAILADQFVQNLMREFGATIVSGSVNSK